MACGDSYEDFYVDTPGHDYITTVIAPTCTEGGYTVYTCATCGDSYVDDHTDPAGHSLGRWSLIKAATCTEDGLGQRNCLACDYYEVFVIPSPGHTYNLVVTEPTCTEDGYITHVCTKCSDSYVDNYMPATGHSHTVCDSKEATCTEDGYIAYICHCGDGYTEIIAAIGHSYVDGACAHCGEADPDAVLMGDTNGDGTINYLDAMLIAQYYVGDIGDAELNLHAADVNGDGIINYLDAMMVAQFYVGDLGAFPD